MFILNMAMNSRVLNVCLYEWWNYAPDTFIESFDME